MNSIEEIAGLLKTKKSAVIFTHMRPDGDTVGCGMALGRALSLCGLKTEVVNEGEIPEKFSYLPAVREIKRRPSLDAELYITVDTSSEGRLGLLEQTYRAGAKRKTTVNIDHHISNTRYAKYNFVRERASNAENVAELISALGVKIEKEIANFLMLGMVTDTGGFSHSDVGGETFRTAALLSDGGASVQRASYETLGRQSKERAEMYLDVLHKLRFLSNDALAVAVISMAELSRFRQKPDATEGIVDFALTIDPVEVSVSLLEVRKGQYKASFRSKGKVDVNAVARIFGGGGHKLASGCMFFGEEEDILDRIRYAVWQHMEDA